MADHSVLDLIRILRAEVCGHQGFAGPSCCILRPGHEGEHGYGTRPPRPTAFDLAVAAALSSQAAELERLTKERDEARAEANKHVVAETTTRPRAAWC